MNIICCCVLCRWSHLTLKFLWNSHYYYYRWGLWNGTKGKNISWGSLSDVPGTMLSESERVAQSCPTLWHPMDCSPPGSSVHGILQARILGWVAIPFSGGSSQPGDWTPVSCIAGRLCTIWATRSTFQMWDYIFLRTTLSSVACIYY